MVRIVDRVDASKSRVCKKTGCVSHRLVDMLFEACFDCFSVILDICLEL